MSRLFSPSSGISLTILIIVSEISVNINSKNSISIDATGNHTFSKSSGKL